MPRLTLREHSGERQRQFYWHDGYLLLQYGSKIGAVGIAIMDVIALRSNKDTQLASVGYSEIARLLGCGRSTVIRKMKELITLKIIKRISVGIGGDSSTYEILELPIRLGDSEVQRVSKQKNSLSQQRERLNKKLIK